MTGPVQDPDTTPPEEATPITQAEDVEATTHQNAPSTSQVRSEGRVSAASLRPFGKRAARQEGAPTRKMGKSQIFTDTPVKEML